MKALDNQGDERGDVILQRVPTAQDHGLRRKTASQRERMRLRISKRRLLRCGRRRSTQPPPPPPTSTSTSSTNLNLHLLHQPPPPPPAATLPVYLHSSITAALPYRQCQPLQQQFHSKSSWLAAFHFHSPSPSSFPSASPSLSPSPNLSRPPLSCAHGATAGGCLL